MKTIEEINKKIKSGKAVVLTASEVKKLAERKSTSDIAKKVDVVTTATFSPMCSSGIFLNLGHTKPPMKMQKVTLDGVPAYGGIAAVDIYLGATEENPDDPRHGGAHVIHKLVKGEKVRIQARGKPTDCYPGDSIDSLITLDKINQAYFFNPRNLYQNYNAATNSSPKTMYTYFGKLKPDYGSVNFSGTGEISPLINDPELRTVGVGSRIFFCGGIGYVVWEGTQFNKNQEKDTSTGLPLGPGATLAIIADLRNLKAEFIRPVVIPGYGISISLAIGVAIPVLDEDIARRICIRNKNIKTRLIDYATGQVVRVVNYHELIEGTVEINNKLIKARTMTDIKSSEKITNLLKNWIESGIFLLTEPVLELPIYGKFNRFPGA